MRARNRIREGRGFNKLIFERNSENNRRRMLTPPTRKSVWNWREVEDGEDRKDPALQIVSHLSAIKIKFREPSFPSLVTNFECANANISPDGISGRVINRRGSQAFEFKNRYQLVPRVILIKPWLLRDVVRSSLPMERTNFCSFFFFFCQIFQFISKHACKLIVHADIKPLFIPLKYQPANFHWYR